MLPWTTSSRALSVPSDGLKWLVGSPIDRLIGLKALGLITGGQSTRLRIGLKRPQRTIRGPDGLPGCVPLAPLAVDRGRRPLRALLIINLHLCGRRNTRRFPCA